MENKSDFLSGNNENNLFYIDNDRQHAMDTSSTDSDTVYSWVNYVLDDNIENLTLYDSFYDENNILIPFEYDNKKEYGHRFLYRYDNCQGNSNVLTEIDGCKHVVTENCGIIAVKNLLIMAGKISEDPENLFPSLGYNEEQNSYWYYDDNSNTPNNTIYINDNSSDSFDRTEAEIINRAISLGLTDHTGTTNDFQRMALLLSYGIDNFYITPNNNFIELITKYTKEGHGIILNSSFHSVAVISVVVDANDNCLGFYVANLNNSISFIDINQIRNNYMNIAIVTTFPILQDKNSATEGTGNNLDNTITGNDKNNILKGESGNDKIYGKDGNDIIIGDSVTLSNDELKKLKKDNKEIDIVYFEAENDGSDYLNGGDGDDLLIGGGGNDILIGGKDGDTLYGGSGNDLLIAGNTTKSTEELENILNGTSTISAADYESDSNKNTLYGGIGNDILIGADSTDILYGGNDDDILFGGNGDDIMYGDDKNNVYEGNDVLVGGNGSDNLYGGKGDDVLIAGDTSLSMASLKNLLYDKENINTNAFETSAGGNNKLYGGEDNDLLIGDKGNDVLNVGIGNDYLYGGKGNDKLIGGKGIDYLDGGDGNDELFNYYDRAIMKGGKGFDKYWIYSNTTNVIEDSDQRGSVYLDNRKLTGSDKKGFKGGNVWVNQGVVYYLNEDTNTLIIDGGLATINNFKNGDLGIKLEKPDDDPEQKPQNPEDANNNMTEPIILDLDGNGFGTTGVSNGLHFDFNGDGMAEKIAWASDGDGVLVADINSNGKIDNGTEVLTAETLSSFDTNNDGVIDANDENFGNLKIMQNDGTVISLAEAGISSISTNVVETDYTDKNGNFLFGEGTFTRTDGTVGNFGEYYFKTDFADTKETDLLEETEAVSALPDVENIGKLRSLHQAMLRDESLKTLVSEFVSTTDDNRRMELLDQILYKLAGCENVEIDSRGDYANAKNLALWEAIKGKDFVSNHEGEYNPSFPNQEAAYLIETEISKFKIKIYAILMQQSHLQTYFDAIDKSNIRYDLTPVVEMLANAIAENATVGKNLVYQFAKMLKGLDLIDSTNFFDPKNDNCFYLKFTQNDRNLKWLIDSIGTIPEVDLSGYGDGTSGDDSFFGEDDEDNAYHGLYGDDVVYGGDGDDSFYSCAGQDIIDGGDGNDEIFAGDGDDLIFGGRGNDLIFGAWGNDTIFGGSGNDIIYPDQVDKTMSCFVSDGNDTISGGKGNDTIYSDYGDDTFIFNLGDGQDVVYEKQGVDTFYFGNGITWADLTFEQVGNDMLIKINNTTDQITVKDWFLTTGENYKYDNNKIEIFEFADGSKHYKDEITAGDNTDAIVYNMDEMEYRYAKTASDYKTIVNLKSGWNHIIAGENSDDTYVFTEEWTDALIENYSGNNTIKFGEGITLENTIFERTEEDLNIWFNDFNGHITITGDDTTFTKFEFADGTIITDLKNYLRKDISSSDYEMGTNTDEVTLIGYDNAHVEGNDRDNAIFGNYGDTTFDGKGGNDYYESNFGGNDTYIFNLGDGYDSIKDVGGIDTVKFGEGITLENIVMLRDTTTNNLEIWFNVEDANCGLTIENYFGGDESKIERFEFADGTVITDITELVKVLGSEDDLTLPDNFEQAHLRGENNTTAVGNDLDNWLGGNNGDNTFAGGKGNDNFWDDKSTSERYVYNIGDGHDVIDDYGGIDAILFGEDVSKDNILFTQDGNNLIISFVDNEEDSICIINYFWDDVCKIEFFRFANGDVISNITSYLQNENGDVPQIVSDGNIVLANNEENATLSGTNDTTVLGNNMDNTIVGNSGNNTYYAGGGDDVITDVLGGNDTYIYCLGNGHDTITDVGGIDTLKLENGIFSYGTKFEQINNDLVLSFFDRDGSITISDYFLDENHKIENIIFSDGEIVTSVENLLSRVVTDYDYTFGEDTIVDTIQARGNSNISIVGNSSDNTIYGNSGDNTYEGKGGNDTFIDEEGGNDTYIYNLGDGFDYIKDVGGSDTIKFGAGITLENLAFKQTATDLEIWFHNEEGALVIENFFSNTNNKIEKFELADGTVITDISNYITAIGSDGDIVLPTGVQQAHLSGSGNTTATGNDINNWIGGNSGDNTFIGGKGDDYIIDEFDSDDTYVYNLGDGNDTINDNGGVDKIKFGAGISKTNLVFIRHTDGSLIINLVDENGDYIDGGINIQDYFNDENKKIEKIEFADGSSIYDFESKVKILAGNGDISNDYKLNEIYVWSDDDCYISGSKTDEFVAGGSGNNTYQLYDGNDSVYDTNGGNDTYIFDECSEKLSILDINGDDTLKITSTSNFNDIIFVRNGNNLRLYFQNNRDQFIQIEDYFLDDDHKIEKIELANGAITSDLWNFVSGRYSENSNIYISETETSAFLEGGKNLTVIGSDNNDHIVGNAGNNTYNAGKGNDYIQDWKGGNDTYIFNKGDGGDTIVDVGGEDTIKFGEGITLNNVYFEDNRGDLIITILNNNMLNDYITVQKHFKSNIRKIEHFEFDDGTIIDDLSPYLTGITVKSNYTLQSDSKIWKINMGGKKNLSVTGNSHDNTIAGNSGNNTFEGKGGNDTFTDEEGGNDTYIYNLGDGHDFIFDQDGNDTIEFGYGITRNNVNFVKNGDGLDIRIGVGSNGDNCNVSGSIFIGSYFNESNRYKIENIKFADGTILTDISSRLVEYTTGEEEYVSENTINSLIQEINSYAPEGEMANGDYNLNNDDLLQLVAC